jgi:hypothetical protein
MPHDFSLWRRSELFSPEQQEKTVDLKNKFWDAAVAACPQASFRPACSQALPALTSLSAHAVNAGRSRYFAQASKLGKAQFWPVANGRGKPPASQRVGYCPC